MKTSRLVFKVYSKDNIYIRGFEKFSMKGAQVLQEYQGVDQAYFEFNLADLTPSVEKSRQKIGLQK